MREKIFIFRLRFSVTVRKKLGYVGRSVKIVFLNYISSIRVNPELFAKIS